MPGKGKGRKKPPAAKRPHGQRAGVTVAMLIASIRKNGALVTLIAEDLGTSTQNIEQRIKRSAELQAAVVNTERRILDVAEGKVIQAIGNSDMPTVRWFLDRKGRKRGYGGSVGTTVTVEGGGGDSPAAVRVEIRAADADL